MDSIIYKITDLVKQLMLFTLCFNLTQCQQMKENDPKLAFQVEICNPVGEYDVTPVYDLIKTLEGTHAGLPYGSSSGCWGDSGKGWTEQYGTPIGADITYYADYEDTFYRLDVNFPIDTIKDYMERAYSRWDDLDGETKEYKRLGRGFTASKSIPENAYDSFSDLVFGFAPKGMVVVWLRFGNTQIELGRYQAEILKDDKKLEERLFASWSMKRSEVRANYLIPNASPREWDNYRTRYNWRPIVVSANSKFRLFEILTYTYDGEKEGALRPWVLNMPYKKKAIPKEMVFTWETGKEKQEQKNARVFFNWEETNAVFEKAGSRIDMQVNIAEDNNSVEILLNGKALKTDSIRIYQWSGGYKESYK